MIEEKAAACNMLYCFASELGPGNFLKKLVFIINTGWTFDLNLINLIILEPFQHNNALLVFSSGKKTKNLPVIGIIPAYNVGGMMNRSSSSRANQDGPEEYGFRGNTQNLDLNRDFIKMDSRNMFTFAKIYHGLDPDVFIIHTFLMVQIINIR